MRIETGSRDSRLFLLKRWNSGCTAQKAEQPPLFHSMEISIAAEKYFEWAGKV
jgi:hypothetical protein